MKPVLVTGSAGYLGRSITAHLLAQDIPVIGYDQIPGPGVNVVRSLQSMALKDFDGVRGVIHLAGVSSDAACDKDPELARKVNVRQTLEIAGLAKRAGVEQFLFASTASLYATDAIGDEEPPLGDERADLTPPTHVYALTKYHAEHELMKLASYSFQVVCLRQGTVYGFGNGPVRFDLAVHKMLMSALFNREIVVKDGRQLRPMLHIQRAAHIYAELISHPGLLSNAYQVLNVADGNWTVSHIADLISQHTHHTPVRVIPGKDTTYGMKTHLLQSLRLGHALPLPDGIYHMILRLREILQETA